MRSVTYCWNPSSRAKTTGILSSRPKNGAGRRDFFMKGRFGYSHCVLSEDIERFSINNG